MKPLEKLPDQSVPPNPILALIEEERKRQRDVSPWEFAIKLLEEEIAQFEAYFKEKDYLPEKMAQLVRRIDEGEIPPPRLREAAAKFRTMQKLKAKLEDILKNQITPLVTSKTTKH